MCFYTDWDWHPELVHEGDSPATERERCMECYAFIEPGQMRHTIWQQEYEECRTCMEAIPTEEVGECKCEPPDYGTEYSYQRCMECHKFLRAVEASEEEAGCPADSRLPYLEMMVESIRDGGRDEAKRYFRRARADYPELVASGYLHRLWCRVLGRRKGGEP